MNGEVSRGLFSYMYYPGYLLWHPE